LGGHQPSQRAQWRDWSTTAKWNHALCLDDRANNGRRPKRDLTTRFISRASWCPHHLLRTQPQSARIRRSFVGSRTG
jgi:hypothetical protein